MKDGKKIGVRLPPFDYTGLKLLSISGFKKMIEQEISRIKNLPVVERVKQKWAGLIERSTDSGLWMEDSVVFMKNIGEAKKKKLVEAGVVTVRDMSNLSDDAIIAVSNVTKIQKKTLTNFRAIAKEAEQGISPYPKSYDYVEGQSNPYKFRYGEEWEKEIVKVRRSGLTRVVCVTDLKEHIESTTKNAFKGTEFETTYRWSHDALKQMTDDDCKAWMKEKKIWHRWIKPELECNDFISVYDETKEKTVTSRHYKDRPVGDSPEMMPLDASLNWDIDCSLCMHVLLTSHLENENPLKFRKDNPGQISKAIIKLYHPETGVVPNSKRIVEDCERIVKSAMTIVKAGGGIVPGLCNRNGHRNKNTTGRKYWPRKRSDQVIATMDDLGIFKEVQAIAMEQIEAETALFNSFQVPIN